MRKHKTPCVTQIVKKRGVKLANSLLDKFPKDLILILLQFKGLNIMKSVFGMKKTRSLMRKREISPTFLFISLFLLVSGCGIYRSGFECPPGR